jgi:hypothetical protein
VIRRGRETSTRLPVINSRDRQKVTKATESNSREHGSQEVLVAFICVSQRGLRSKEKQAVGPIRLARASASVRFPPARSALADAIYSGQHQLRSKPTISFGNIWTFLYQNLQNQRRKAPWLTFRIFATRNAIQHRGIQTIPYNLAPRGYKIPHWVGKELRALLLILIGCEPQVRDVTLPAHKPYSCIAVGPWSL